MKREFYITLLNLKKKKNLLVFVTMLIIFFMLFLLLNISLNFNEYMYNLKYKDIYARTLMVDISSSKLEEETIEGFEHVSSVIEYNNRLDVIKLDGIGEISLFGIDGKEYEKIKIIDGTKKLGNYNIICPDTLIAASDLDNNDYYKEHTYNTKKLLNKKYDVILKKTESVFNEETMLLETNVLDTKTEKFTIVGTYDNKKYNLQSNTCFILKDDTVNMHKYYYVDYDKYVDVIDPSFLAVLVDEIGNKEELRNKLMAAGCTVMDAQHIETFSIVIITVIGIVLFAIIIFVISITIRLIIKRDLNIRKNELLVYKCIGYAKKSIKNIFSFEYLITIFISLIFAIILGIIIINIIVKWYEPFLTYYAIDITIKNISYLIMIIIGIIYSSIIIRRSISRVLEDR